MKRLLFAIMTFAVLTNESSATTEALSPKQRDWAFDGMLGKVDKQSAQRGFQVYKEVCSACHSLHHLYYRNLETPKGSNEAERKKYDKMGLGFSKEEVKAIASNYTVPDIDDEGNPTERKALPADKFVGPYANEKAARASNNGALPPDLSLIVKAREDGPNYVYSILTGFTDPPAGIVTPEGQHYNPYFGPQFIAMPPPLKDGIISYSDGTVATVDQMATDVVNFLQWAAEPEMEQRKSIGLKVLMYLSISTILFYISKCRIWARLNKFDK
jgi:ubiquinol-cytochrome c reductase cytochrome c1 subunit